MNPLSMGLLLGRVLLVGALAVRVKLATGLRTLAIWIELLTGLGALGVRVVLALLDIGRLGAGVERAGGAVVLVGALRIRVELVAGLRTLLVRVKLVADFCALAVGVELLLVGLRVGYGADGCHDSYRCHEGKTFVRHLKLLSYGSFGLADSAASF